MSNGQQEKFVSSLEELTGANLAENMINFEPGTRSVGSGIEISLWEVCNL